MTQSSMFAAPRSMTRRDFTLQSALAVLSGCVITVAGCGGSSPAAPSQPAAADVSGTITGNHGHTAVIKAAQITAGNGVSLDIQGTASHPHTVEVTQADLAALKSRQPVTKSSSTDASHQHSVTFTPA